MKISYINIGANHPYSLNNTALFYENGSRGINIEPNSILFSEIASVCKKDINIMAGIGDSNSVMPFYVMNNSALSTFSKHEAKTYRDKHTFKIVDITNVNVKTLKSVIEAHCVRVFPDFMSLDKK